VVSRCCDIRDSTGDKLRDQLHEWGVADMRAILPVALQWEATEFVMGIHTAIHR
jgi:hypothetical protein